MPSVFMMLGMTGSIDSGRGRPIRSQSLKSLLADQDLVRLTIHKIWQVHPEWTLGRIVVCENPVVIELPTKCVRNDDYDSFGLCSIGRFCYITVEAVNFSFMT